MRKTLFVAVLSIVAKSLQAQSIAAGTVSAGGSIGYSQFSGENSSVVASKNGQNTNRSSKSSGKQLYFAPAVSYFVVDNLAIGVNLGYANGTRTDEAMYNPALTYQQYGKLKAISLWAGAFAQYYKMLGAQFGLTSRLGAGYQRATEERSGQATDGQSFYYYTGTNTNVGYYADLTPGIVFFPVPKFGISAVLGSLSFSHYKLTDASYNDTNGNSYALGPKNDSDAFSANFGLDAFRLGGTYYFGR